ncbi:MAG: GNAT family N-acetyltransferase [Lentisphaeria bacterium]|nr:GNAT family N-acetyltransferase [Lentisphaeria bacterium]
MAELAESHFQEVYELWLQTGWNIKYNISLADFIKSWKGSSVRRCVWVDRKIVAIARANTDGLMYAMIHDVVVDPNFRGQGFGREIVLEIIECLKEMQIKSIQLMTANGQIGFYENLGFRVRSDSTPGMDFIQD